MKEWNQELNSFNSMKGLLYAPWYDSIENWRRGYIPAPFPPVEASLDPIHSCNLMCQHCNAHRYLEEKEVPGLQRMTDEHLINLVRFLGQWGVKAICFGGGGEPTLHTKLSEAIGRTAEWGMDASVATNGTLFTDELMESMAYNCRWVGVSIDAATRETYMIGRKADMFDRAIENLRKFVAIINKDKANRCDVAYKFLVMDYNQYEIYDACKLAKEIGVKDFHARPADFRHQGMGEWQKKNSGYDTDKIKEQFEKCHELEDENFHVYTILHKFNEDFTPKKNFTQCYASPCCIQLCADGNIYLCPDTRHMEFYKLGSHAPDPREILKIWGGDRHYELVFKTGRENCTTRCTFAPYCRQCEELFIKDNDPMCWKFI